ncbi:hypothetical protein ACQ4M4_22430 [Leptolyngbya sp. AN02str]|uniref:hypothetical protein n=1 Tax=Leptolyngbya sp. AN02str TaxID=3423363 RepID=UPI003D320D51
MNQNQFSKLQLNLSGLWGWVGLFAFVWLLGSIGLGWLVKSVLFLIAFLAIAPVIGFFVFRWWLQRNVVEAACPVCGTLSAGLNGTQMRCPSCSEALKVEQGKFLRITPPGTVDVEAIEVSAKQIED